MKNNQNVKLETGVTFPRYAPRNHTRNEAQVQMDTRSHSVKRNLRISCRVAKRVCLMTFFCLWSMHCSLTHLSALR